MQIDYDAQCKHPNTRSHPLFEVDTTHKSAFVMFSHNTLNNSKNTPATLGTTTKKKEDAKYFALLT